MGFAGPDRTLQQHRIAGPKAGGQPTPKLRRVFWRGKMKMRFGQGI